MLYFRQALREDASNMFKNRRKRLKVFDHGLMVKTSKQQAVSINPFKNCLLFIVYCLLLTTFCFLSSASPSSAVNGNGNGFDNSNQPIILKNVAILPLENLSENPAAAKMVAEHIKKELMSKGLVFITTDNIVEEFLAKKRLRYTGGVTRATVREMGKVLGVDAVLVGSVNQFSDTNDKIKVGVTARLVNTINGSIIWADALSYTNRDFVGLLGLGGITSIDALSSRVAKDLIKDIGDKYFIKKEAALSPFEIEKVEAYPADVVRGGTKIGLRVRVLGIIEEPREIKAIIAGDEFSLSKGEGGEYEGYITAPTVEGVYPVDVIAIDQTISQYKFAAVGNITADNTPPKVSLTVSRKAFAPQKKGYIVFTPKLLSYDNIDEWEIDIFDRDGKKLRGDKGYGTLPKGLIWRGETDKFALVSDGDYSYRFMVKDSAGNETVLTDSVRVKNTPPVLKIDVDKVEDKLLFTFDHSQDENIKSWKLSILDKVGKAIKVIEGSGGLPPKFEYPIESEFDINTMVFSITATDDADNPVSLTKSIPSMLSRKTPFAKVNTRDQWAEDF
jgi:TolB-like protein